jgi:hypothetical protein
MVLVVANRLDVMAIGIEDEGGVIARRVIAVARSAVILRAVGQRGVVKGVYLGPAGCLKRDVGGKDACVPMPSSGCCVRP